MAEGFAVYRELCKVLDVAPGKENGEKCHTVDSPHSRYKDGVDVVVCKRKGICHDDLIVLKSPTDIDVAVVFPDVTSKGQSTTSNTSNIGRETKMPVLTRSCSLQATGVNEEVG